MKLVSVTQDDEEFMKHSLQQFMTKHPIDIIIDYLWGHTAEMILACYKRRWLIYQQDKICIRRQRER